MHPPVPYRSFRFLLFLTIRSLCLVLLRRRLAAVRRDFRRCWNRIAVSADLTAGTVKYYINGNLVGTRTGTALTDGRFAIYTNTHAGADLLLEPIRQAAARRCGSWIEWDKTRIVAATLGEAGGLLGAAHLAWAAVNR